MALMQSLEEKWSQFKGPLLGLIVGLIVGPFVSGMIGWQVTTSTMEEYVEEAVTEQQAEMCAYLARQEVGNAADLEWQKRQDVAEKYAKLPWEQEADYDVVSRCTGILAEKPDLNTGDKS